MTARRERNVLIRTSRRFVADAMWDWAAALTYYGVLSIFPGLLVMASTVGLLSPEAMDRLVTGLGKVVPAAARQILLDGIAQLGASRATAGVMALVGLATALWAASGYVAAFIRASNMVYHVPEGRPLWKILPLRLIVTVVVGLLMIVAEILVLFTGGVARFAGEQIGAGGVAVTIWGIVKWPALVLVIALALTVLYWSCPNAHVGGFGGVAVGGAVAVVSWVVMSTGFGFYAANFASYNATYGALGGIIIFLVWLWLSNMAILFGAELNAERLRDRASDPEHAEPELRDDRKLSEETRQRLRADRPDSDSDSGEDEPPPEPRR